MRKFLFRNKFIIFLNMFQALCAHHQEVKIVLYSIWYHHTETSEWSKITNIQFYKYKHIVVKFIYEFFGCDYCIFLHYKHVMSCRGYIYPVVKLIKRVLRLFTLCICWVYLVIKSYKLLINCCMYSYIRLLNNVLVVKKYAVITPKKLIHKFYYYVLIFIELYFSNFRPLTCFSVMIPDAV